MKASVIEFILTIKLFFFSRWRKVTGGRKRYPRVVQLPITYNCNSKCVMCNIWQMDYSNEFTLEEFDRFTQDRIFSKVEYLGINGGEPTLIKELPQFAGIILKNLPKLKALNIITHGFNKKQLFPALENIYTQCKAANVKFHAAISLDGVGKIHDTVRGLKVSKLTQSSILEIVNHPGKYCDTFDVGCTVVKQNVDYLTELKIFAEENNIPIKFRMGIENKRIESQLLTDQFSLLYDESIQSSREFFHRLYVESSNWLERFKYFSIYYFLVVKEKRRLLGCHWKDNGMTMDSRGDLYYCAVESEKIGSLRESSGEKIFFSDENINYRKTIIEEHCNNCIHDYTGTTEANNVFFFLKSYLSDKFYWVKFYLKAKLI
ncbi:MAG: hypothetical protein R2730_12280 [Chitinophagales bacterium]